MLDPHENSIEWNHLPNDIVEDLSIQNQPLTPVPPARMASKLEYLANTAIQQALASSKGNVSQAARILGVSRQTLYRKMAQDGKIACER
jgi:transcriptional regulator with PAS, ATPase and Fis domain